MAFRIWDDDYHREYDEGVVERLIYSRTVEVRFGEIIKHVGQTTLRRGNFNEAVERSHSQLARDGSRARKEYNEL